MLTRMRLNAKLYSQGTPRPYCPKAVSSFGKLRHSLAIQQAKDRHYDCRNRACRLCWRRHNRHIPRESRSRKNARQRDCRHESFHCVAPLKLSMQKLGLENRIEQLTEFLARGRVVRLIFRRSSHDLFHSPEGFISHEDNLTKDQHTAPAS